MGMEAYTKLRKLGQGSFGSVFLIQDKQTNKQYVLKEVDLSQMGSEGRREALKEVAFLAKLEHPGIISYREWFEESPSGSAWKSHQKQLYIVMEYANGGDLSKRIQARKTNGMKPFSEQEIVHFTVQILLAVKHMHDRKVLHRDIKSENIFLTNNNLVKIGDFGISKALPSTYANAHTRIGTPYYLSPEICMNKPYNTSSDMWSVGVVLYELMALQHPFDAPSMEKLLQRICTGKHQPLSRRYTRNMRRVVEDLLQKNASRRPTVTQLLQIPWVQAEIPKFLNRNEFEEEFSHTILHSYNFRPDKIQASPKKEGRAIGLAPGFDSYSGSKESKQIQPVEQQRRGGQVPHVISRPQDEIKQPHSRDSSRNQNVGLPRVRNAVPQPQHNQPSQRQRQTRARGSRDSRGSQENVSSRERGYPYNNAKGGRAQPQRNQMYQQQQPHGHGGGGYGHQGMQPQANKYGDDVRSFIRQQQAERHSRHSAHSRHSGGYGQQRSSIGAYGVQRNRAAAAAHLSRMAAANRQRGGWR